MVAKSGNNNKRFAAAGFKPSVKKKTTGKRVGKSKLAKANNQLNRRVK